jgi:tRNA threonylcarbamoyladenosine biosynthesis protein TsaE
MKVQEILIKTDSPYKTMAVAEGFAKRLPRGTLVALNGELGAGKTVFVKGIAKGLGVPDHLYVNSPTFVIMKEYHGDMPLYHFDVYRLDKGSFEESVDHERYFYGDGVTVVEWADKVADLLPEDRVDILIEHISPSERSIRFTAAGKKLSSLLEKILEHKVGGRK